MHALRQRAVHERAHNDQECHFPPPILSDFPPPILSERCRRLAAGWNLRGRDRGRGDSSFIVPPPIHHDDPVHSIWRGAVVRQVVAIDPAVLEAAQARDQD